MEKIACIFDIIKQNLHVSTCLQCSCILYENYFRLKTTVCAIAWAIWDIAGPVLDLWTVRQRHFISFLSICIFVIIANVPKKSYQIFIEPEIFLSTRNTMSKCRSSLRAVGTSPDRDQTIDGLVSEWKWVPDQGGPARNPRVDGQPFAGAESEHMAQSAFVDMHDLEFRYPKLGGRLTRYPSKDTFDESAYLYPSPHAFWTT